MCIEESRILKLAAGELGQAEAQQALAHLEACASCRARYEDFRRTWGLLGSWGVEARGADLTARILAAARREQHSASGTRVRSWLRMAAAVVLASGVGVAAGWMTVSPGSAPPARAEATTEDVVEALGLDVLASDTGLTHALELPPEMAPLDNSQEDPR